MFRNRILFNLRTASLCCGFVVALALGCREESLSVGDSVSQTSRTVPTVSVQAIELTDNAYETVSYFGRVVPAQQADLSFTTSGVVATVNAEPGQSVIAGDVLAAFDQADLESRRAALEQQQVNESSRRRIETSLEQLDAEAKQRTLVAPFAGTITKQHVSVGSLASPQRPAFRMVSLATPLIEIEIPVKVSRRIAVGETFWMQLGGQPFRASVKRKQPNVSRSGLTSLIFAFAEKSPGQLDIESLSFGQAVEIQFLLETKNSGFWVPRSSLQQQDGGLWSILIAKPTDGQAITLGRGTNLYVTESRTIQVVQFDDDRVLVAGQIRSGDRVVTKGAFRIVAGQTVKTNAALESRTSVNESAPLFERARPESADPSTATGSSDADVSPTSRGPRS